MTLDFVRNWFGADELDPTHYLLLGAIAFGVLVLVLAATPWFPGR